MQNLEDYWMLKDCRMLENKMTGQTQEEYARQVECARKLVGMYNYTKRLSKDILKAGGISLLVGVGAHTVFSGLECLTEEQNFSETFQSLQGFKASFIGGVTGLNFAGIFRYYRG